MALFTEVPPEPMLMAEAHPWANLMLGFPVLFPL